jgi:hypothetical protein
MSLFFYLLALSLQTNAFEQQPKTSLRIINETVKDGNASSEKIDVCSSIVDPTTCVSKTSFGVNLCSWCIINQQCHAVGSAYNPCPNQCCASRSPLTSCDWRNPSEIDLKWDGDCVLAGNYSNTTAYNPSEALKMVHYAGASYCPASMLMSWSCIHCRSLPGFDPKKVITIPSQDIQVLIGYDNDVNTIVIAYQGTTGTSVTNWVANFNLTLTSPWPSVPSAQVHSGFWATYLATRQQVLDYIATMPRVPIQIVGHSQGGSVANLCAFELATFYGYTIKNVYTFGSPRTGTYDWTAWFRSRVANSWRVTHARDIVAHTPPRAGSSYYHVILEVFYPDDRANYFRVCDASGEDP